jgi:hypothetical protein
MSRWPTATTLAASSPMGLIGGHVLAWLALVHAGGDAGGEVIQDLLGALRVRG